MADRNVEETYDEVPDIPELAEKILLYALDEGKAIMSRGELLVPFTALAIKNNLFIESHQGDNVDECFNEACKTVMGARGADAYAFVYDGYVETDDGDLDVLIAEGGLPGDDEGFAIGYVYTLDDDENPVFEEEPVFIGDAPNFMSDLKESEEYAEEEIDERYLNPVTEEDGEEE